MLDPKFQLSKRVENGKHLHIRTRIFLRQAARRFPFFAVVFFIIVTISLSLVQVYSFFPAMETLTIRDMGEVL